MKKHIIRVVVQLICIGGLHAETIEIENKILADNFYSGALVASWVCRDERAINSPENERRKQHIKMTAFAFRYWIYMSKKIIGKDPKFEHALYMTYTHWKNIDINLLDDPLQGPFLIRSVPGFKWSEEEYKELVQAFKKYILAIKDKDVLDK
jgi:hypothetical protein